MMVLAFLPQHVWQVMAGVLAAVFVAQGLFLLIKGTSAPEVAWMSERAVRVMAWLVLSLGGGIGIAAVFVHAEAPGSQGNQWGGATGVAILGGWLVLLAVLEAFRFRTRKRRP
jgi:hypothetical protein